MRFLADMGMSPSTVAALRQAGHDAVHLRDEGLQRLSDELIFEKARQEDRVVLTFDLDFAGIVARTRASLPSGILFRLRTARPDQVTALLFRVLPEIENRLSAGAVVTIEPAGYRLGPMPFPAPGTDRIERP